MCWPREGPFFWHRKHSTPRQGPARSMCRGRGNWRIGGCLRPALTPGFQVVEHAIAACALQGVGVAHGARLVACNYPVVAGGTTVAAAVSGWGRVHREGGTQILHSGDLFLMGILVWDSGDRTKATEFGQMRRVPAGHGQGCSRSMGSHTHGSGWAAAKISQPLPSSLPVQQSVNRWSLVGVQLMHLHHISLTDREGALCSPSLEGCGLRAAC